MRGIGRTVAGIVALVAWAGAADAQTAPPRPATAATPPRAAAPASSLMSTPPRAEPSPAPAADAKPDPAFEAARASFEALPEADRRAVQEALVWTGDFNGVDSGTFGRRTYDALLLYGRRTKPAPTGILDERERAALTAAGRKAREAAGFALRTDPATGVALGVPGRVLPREQPQPHGTRWQSADGRVTLETRGYAPGETDLAATFDRLAAATPDRRVTYKLKRPTFLVVTGETPTGRFYIRYADTPAGLRGFTFSYDKAAAAETDKLVIAVANSFVPQPAAAPGSSAEGSRPQANPGLGPIPTVGPVPTRPASPAAITALEVAPGRLLASAVALATCGTARLGTTAVRVIARTDAFALLAGAERPRGAALRVGPEPGAGDALVVLASDGTGGAVAISGDAAGPRRITAPLQPGSAGAPVFDRGGRLVGTVASFPAAPRMIAGIVPPAAYDLQPATAAAAFLRENAVVLAADANLPPASTGEIAAAHAPAVRTLACSS